MSDIEQSFPGSATEDEKEEPSKREDNSSRTTSRSSAQSALSSVDVELDETEWGTDEETEKEEEPVESSVCDTGTQTEWSWIADFLALTKLRGIDVDDEGVAEPSKPETASALTVTTLSQATAQSSAADESARPPSSIASTKASAAAAAAVSSTASRRQIADLPEILRYIRESELPPLASNDTLRRPSTVPPSVSLPACISAVCRLCDVNLADQSQSELNIYCPMCVNLLQDHARTLNDDDEDEKISLIDISTTKSRKRSSKDKDGGDRASSEVSGRAASSIGFHRQLSPKEKRKAGRERAMAKLRERELEAKMREHEIARQRALGDPYSSMYDRNMKTITYALSSQRCLDKGWTIRPRKPRPKPRESDKPDVVEMKDHMRMAKDCVLERYYADDTPFLLFMPDGSGQCYYPSGNVAVSVASYETGFNYVIKADGPKPHNDDNDDNEKLCLSSDDFDEFMSANEDEKKTNDDVSSRRKEGQILAYFSPSGHGCCYHENGVARLVLEPFGGAVYDSHGAQKKRWHWRDSPQRHQHVPPCQPIWFALNRHVSIRCSDQDNVTVTFSCRQRTVRFSVGWNLKWKAGARPSRTISGGELWRGSLRATRRRLNGLLVGLNEALRYPKTCERRIVALRPTGESASKIRIA